MALGFFLATAADGQIRQTARGPGGIHPRSRTPRRHVPTSGALPCPQSRGSEHAPRERPRQAVDPQRPSGSMQTGSERPRRSTLLAVPPARHLAPVSLPDALPSATQRPTPPLAVSPPRLHARTRRLATASGCGRKFPQVAPAPPPAGWCQSPPATALRLPLCARFATTGLAFRLRNHDFVRCPANHRQRREEYGAARALELPLSSRSPARPSADPSPRAACRSPGGS